MEGKEDEKSAGAELAGQVNKLQEEAKELLEEWLNDEVKWLLDRRYTFVLGALLIVALVAGYVAYTSHTANKTVSEERVTSVWSTSTEFQHGVTVQRDAIVFQEGVTLEDRTLYFTSLSPVLNISYVVRHGGDEPEPASARAELRLILRSVDGGTELWRESRRLASVNSSSLEPGEPLEANFSVNVTESVERINEIEENLSASPGSTQILVSAETAIEGEVSGGAYTDTRSERLRINPSSGTYSVSAEVEGQKSEETTEVVVTEIEPSFLTAYGSILVALVALVFLSATVWAKREGVFELTQEKVDEMEFESQRKQFDEWISRGSVSGDGASTEVCMDSLEGVVDVAIDSNRRVTEDDGSYVVLVDDVRYVFEPDFDTEPYSGVSEESSSSGSS